MKNFTSLRFLGLVTLAAFGCGEAPQAQEVNQAAAALSQEDCAAERDACFRENPLFGLLSCPAQYAQCTAAAESGIAKEVAAAVKEVAACTRAAAGCAAEASSAEGAAKCATTEARCVASVVDVELPQVVEGTAKCVGSAVECVNKSESGADLVACGTSLEGCAIEEAKNAVPPEVSKVIGEVSDCTKSLNGCIAEASNASGLTACNEQQVTCVAGSLGVELPKVPLSKGVECAEDAASCALDAESVRAVANCAESLRKCAVSVVEATDAPEQLSCEKKWTVCVGNDPLKFLQCAAELAGCKD
jgi:hypothetical protein